MKSICITGAIANDLDRIADIFQRAGMATPRLAVREPPIDLTLWHEQVLAMESESAGAAQSLLEPGRLWEQLASDIFLSNIRSDIWGWANSQSTWLLDFWCEFEPRLYFVLVCVTPEQMLAQAMIAEDADISVDDVMQAWSAHHEQLLRFHHRNPQRSLLVEVADCIAHPVALISHCSAQWNLPLQLLEGAVSGQTDDMPLATYLARQFCSAYPQVAGLQNELKATLTHLVQADDHQDSENIPSSDSLIANFRELHDHRSETLQLISTQEALANLQDRLDAMLVASSEEIARLAAELDHSRGLLAAALHEGNEGKARIENLSQTATLLEQEVIMLAGLRDEQSRIAAAQETTIGQQAKENELLLLQLHQIQEELESIFLDRETKAASLDALTQSQAALEQEKATLAGRCDALEQRAQALSAERDSAAREATEVLQPKLRELEQENELLLLQLHQVQEELESIFLEGQAKQTRIEALSQSQAALEQSSATLAQARDEQTRLAAERQTQIDTLVHAKAELEQEKVLLGDRCRNLEQSSAALAQARDEQTRLAAERQTQIDTLVHAKAELEQRAQVLSAERDSAAREATEVLQPKLRELGQENELLLLQLHQVQEELEHYFLKYQEIQSQAGVAEARWKRMLQRTPDYIDFDTIEATPGETPGAANWRIRNLSAAGRTLSELEFGTLIEHDFTGLVLGRKPGTAGSLLRWPASVAKQDEFLVLPVGTKEQTPLRHEILLDLGTSDWELVNRLVRLLDKVLETPSSLKLATDFPVVPLRRGLARLATVFSKFPDTVRYDRVTLKREQINPDYEHLWLQFDNLSFGAQRWPVFEFRLACANVRPGQFGSHPKLEFPETNGKAPFEAWFAESHDDFGAKLELRFSLPESMDLGVWQKLSGHDRAFLVSLIKRLPAILANLQVSGLQVRRGLKDWLAMVTETQRILALRTAPPKLPAVTPAPMVRAQTVAPAVSPSVENIAAQVEQPAPAIQSTEAASTRITAEASAQTVSQPEQQPRLEVPAKTTNRRAKVTKVTVPAETQPAPAQPAASEATPPRAKRSSRSK